MHFLKEKIKKNNLGFTLVELICAIAILAIISVSIVTFITVSSTSFKESNTEVNLQYETQVAVNRIKDLIMDTNRAVCYYVTPGAEAGDPDVANNLLVLNEEVATDGTVSYPAVKIWYVPNEQKIYYSIGSFTESKLAEVYNTDGKREIKMEVLGADTQFDNKSVLAEHVSSFSVNDSDTENSGKVVLSVGMTLGRYSYSSNPTIIMRNKVIANDDVAEIYDGSKRVVRNKAEIKSFTISCMGTTLVDNQELSYETPFLITKPSAGSYMRYFSASVEAYEADDRVEWKLEREDGTPCKSTISPSNKNCEVYISSEEAAGKLIITATVGTGTSYEKKKTAKLVIGDYDLSKVYVNKVDIGTLSESFNEFNTEVTYSVVAEEFFEWGNPRGTLEDGQKGITCTIVDEYGNVVVTPTIAEISEEKSRITFSINDKEYAGKKLSINVLTNALDNEANKVSAQKDFFVSNELVDPHDVPCEVVLSAGTTTCNRNQGYDFSITKSTFDISSIVWCVNGKEVKPSDKYTVSEKSGFSGGNIFFFYNLDWDKDHTIQLSALVSGTNLVTGEKISEYPTNSITFKIGKVVVTGKPDSTSKLKKSYGGTRNVKLTFTNLNWDDKCSSYIKCSSRCYYTAKVNKKTKDIEVSGKVSHLIKENSVSLTLINDKYNQGTNAELMIWIEGDVLSGSKMDVGTYTWGIN